MADYFTQTVVTPNLPGVALTATDRLLLDMLFQSEAANGGCRYYFAADGIEFEGETATEAVRAAISDSPPCLSRLVLEKAIEGNDATVPIDIAGQWEAILQDILRRATDLDHLIVITAYSCSKMRPDGFGGAATVITRDAIDSLSTFEFIDTVLAERLSAKP